MKVKQFIVVIISPLIMLAFLTSCSRDPNFSSRFGILNDDELANETVQSIIDGINENNPKIIEELFAPSVQQDNSIELDTDGFINFIEGDIVSFTWADENGIGQSMERSDGKVFVETDFAFTIITTENTYYLGMIECLRDDNNPDNIGLTKLCVINSNDWDLDFSKRGVYRASSMETNGITLDDGSSLWPFDFPKPTSTGYETESAPTETDNT